MQDYSISKCTRKCASSGRDLEPGERYISVILADDAGEGVRRLDIAESEWTGPKPEMIGFWKAAMPQKTAAKLRPAPNGVLLDTLSELVDNPDSAELAYLLALLLVRRRVLTEDVSWNEDQAEDKELPWNLVCNADDRHWSITQFDPSPDRLLMLQEQLNDLLFTEE